MALCWYLSNWGGVCVLTLGRVLQKGGDSENSWRSSCGVYMIMPRSDEILLYVAACGLGLVVMGWEEKERVTVDVERGEE